MKIKLLHNVQWISHMHLVEVVGFSLSSPFTKGERIVELTPSSWFKLMPLGLTQTISQGLVTQKNPWNLKALEKIAKLKR